MKSAIETLKCQKNNLIKNKEWITEQNEDLQKLLDENKSKLEQIENEISETELAIEKLQS